MDSKETNEDGTRLPNEGVHQAGTDLLDQLEMQFNKREMI